MNHFEGDSSYLVLQVYNNNSYVMVLLKNSKILTYLTFCCGYINFISFIKRIWLIYHLSSTDLFFFFFQVRCMKLVQHPNVVRLYEVIDTQTKLYLILELGDGGDLYDLIMRHDRGLDEPRAKEYFRQIVRAISYCHRLHVVHRYIKCFLKNYRLFTRFVRQRAFDDENIILFGFNM